MQIITIMKREGKHILSLKYILVFLLLSNLSLAQQWHSYNPTAWFDINAITLPEAGAVAIGGGQESNDSIQIMFRGDNYGFTWTENAHDGPNPWNRSIAFSDSLHGYAVGYDGRIISSDDGGYNWGHDVYPINRDFNKIINVNPTTWFVAGGNKTNDSIQTILKSSNNGVSWDVIYDNPGSWLKSIYFINAIKGYAVGDNGVILGTLNGGNSWSTMTPPINRDFNAITFVNTDTGYIVGGSQSGISTILRTVDGGANWAVLIDMIGGVLNDISFASSTEGYIVGTNATVLKTTDGGLSWNPFIIDPNLIGNEVFNAVNFHGPNFGAIGGKAGVLYILGDPLLMEVQTQNVGLFSSTQVEFHASINTRGQESGIAFHYSTDSTFSTSSVTGFQTLTSDSVAPVARMAYDLLPDTTYYYYAAAEIWGGEHAYGDTLSFRTNVPYTQFMTLNATSLSGDSAILEGFVHGVTEPMSLFFEFGSTSFSNEISASPGFIDDTSQYAISMVVDSLLPNQIYHFRLKGVSPTGTYYANANTFYNGILFDVFETANASAVSNTSATLNGLVDNFVLPAGLSFQYGPAQGPYTNIIATPDSIIDTLQHSITANVTGLQPNTVYYCSLFANTSGGSFYANNISFYTGTLFQTLQALPANAISETSAMLNGYVQGLAVPASLNFEYGTTPEMGIWTNANPGSIADGGSHNITSGIGNLTPQTLYYFRLVAHTQAGNIYSNTQTFYSSMPAENILPLACTAVTHTSAQFNGIVNHISFPVQLFFEYGLDENFGNTIAANPISINDTLEHSISASVTGLMTGSFYYYRIKAVNGLSNYYSNRRKLFTGNPEVPNWDLQDWSRDTVLLPYSWNLAGEGFEQVSDNSGGHALKLFGQTYALLGLVRDDPNGGLDFLGGQPFNARPDFVNISLNYNLEQGDSALFLVHMHNVSGIVSSHFYRIGGNSGGAFSQLSFPLTYENTEFPDSVVFALLPFNPFTNQQSFSENNFIVVDEISFNPAAPPIYNADLEHWFQHDFDDLLDWDYVRFALVNPQDIPGSSMITKAIHLSPDDYAAELKTRYFEGNWFQPDIATGNTDNGGGPHFKVDGKHQVLNGYYKYSMADEDTCKIEVLLYKDGNQIGYGVVFGTDTLLDYSPFEMTLNYNYQEPNAVPDSAAILLSIRSNQASGYSKLSVDKLSFDGFWTGPSENLSIPLLTSNRERLFIYPNPSAGLFSLEFVAEDAGPVTYSIYTILGNLVFSRTDQIDTLGRIKRQFNLSGRSSGVYFVNVYSRKLNYSGKLVKQ